MKTSLIYGEGGMERPNAEGNNNTANKGLLWSMGWSRNKYCLDVLISVENIIIQEFGLQNLRIGIDGKTGMNKSKKSRNYEV